jgi:hypothetical protein
MSLIMRDQSEKAAASGLYGRLMVLEDFVWITDKPEVNYERAITSELHTSCEQCTVRYRPSKYWIVLLTDAEFALPLSLQVTSSAA